MMLSPPSGRLRRGAGVVAWDIPEISMSTTDNNADNFWSDLRYRIARAAHMTPVEASKMMGRFLRENCDHWPYSKAIAESADRRAMYERAIEIQNAPTLEATARWEHQSGSHRERDQEVSRLQFDLYSDARVGLAAAEYNLEKAGMIEMIQGHHAGIMLPSGPYWDDLRWISTDRGRRASDALLERIMLRDPPLEIAEWDAEDEANDVADDCGGCDVDDPTLAMHRRISANLDKRAECIRQKMARRAKREDGG
jgi:hypothetical protein